MNEQLLTVDEAKDRLGIGRTKFYEYLGNGSLRAVRLGRRRMVPASEVDRFIARAMEEGSPDAA